MAREHGVEVPDDQKPSKTSRTGFLWLSLFVLLLNGSWAVYFFQYNNLPMPLTAEQAGKRGFSEVLALAHVKNLTEFGPHPVGSDAHDLAIQYVLSASENIKKSAHWEADVQVDLFSSKTGANRLVGGLFKGKTLVYSDLKHVVLRILPKYLPEAEENVVLVSSHIDTVFSTGGAGDCSSCVAVMLELARGISQWAHGFRNGIIFLFNSGEEEGLDGAHSFITQHPWRNTIRFAIDLEAMGVGGKSSIFQTSMPWGIETYANVAKYPSGQIISQDLFLSGAIKSATDFQIYKEIAGLPGLDFAFVDSSAVYHTKNDKLKLLKPGSLQHLGENMLAFLILLHAARSPDVGKMTVESDRKEESKSIYFDVLGMYMIVYSQRLASMLSNSVMLQALLLWTTSLVVGGFPAVKSFVLSCFCIILMWLFSLGLSVLIAFIIPLISSSPVPYIANPWLLAGLFGAPAVLGAISGQHIGFIFLQKHLRKAIHERMESLSVTRKENSVKWEAERWVFKAGLIQWLILLFIGNFYKVGSSYLAFVWLVSPAFAYGLMEATLSPVRLPKPLKITTLFLGLTIPFLLSSGVIIKLVGTITGTLVRFDRNPGGTPEWLGSVILAVFIASIVCLTLVYLLSYVHISDVKGSIVLSVCALMGLSLIAIATGFFPTFTEDIGRTVNVVHVVETNSYAHNQEPSSYVTLFSLTPGNLVEESKGLKDEEFDCGRKTTLDFISFTVKYGCLSFKDTDAGWNKLEIPLLDVESDSTAGFRTTRVLVDTKHSKRWSLAINTELITDFSIEVDSEELVPTDEKSSVDGWHIIQFSGGKNSPTIFHFNLIWRKNATQHNNSENSPLLLKLRTDVNRITPKIARVLEKLPPWCSLFGKSTSPYTLAFLTSLSSNF
ncbi:LOW QUALITY PROTEIN: endoplasmic reticulum metallopeptidase 1 [Phalaenopsis equestris]|uniref:LOW QUALITY PROTEIN: endoplasmic reticulum metallopeptidase 1 n=1 Tax=Phalaenopsis equestris TaxID=78828 RepID=UPI0009E31A22|nr:LOW QUALITY PROTEIN: endoplasmic reticulum metallopeptidase 1 [Phalaenopsis equestris]